MKQSTATIIEQLQQHRYKEAEYTAKDLIRVKPLEAQSWVYLGEALMHQGCGRAATQVFNRAWLLDPEAAWVVSVFEALKKIPDGDERDDIAGLLHTRKVTITAGIITYNMEATIERCLDSLQGAVDEIVIIDCSTDRTVELAQKYPNVTIVPFVWVDDFAAARNEGLRHMNTDWVFWMDADEYLATEDRHYVREAAAIYHHSPIPPILCIWQVNLINGQVKHNFAQARLFPLRRGLRYWGRVHEQVSTETGIYNAEARRHKVKIRVLHDGYEPDIMKSKNKLARNVKLLRLMIQEDPEDPAAWFYLGRELLGAGQEQEALEALMEAEGRSISNPLFGRMLDVYKYLTEIYYRRQNWEHALTCCQKALAIQPDFPDAHYLLSLIRIKQADLLYQEAEAGLKRARESFRTYRSFVAADHEIAEWKAEYALAEIAHRGGKSSTARSIYRNIAKRHPRTANLIQSKLHHIEAERQRLNGTSE
ncbi:glycosyltransferase [Bacillus sp. 3255]|uniref:glycosyltransferase n=1 Tax=Bacillus sp. 3255 TaxID=2817904 RepID=UPI00285720ED|nr:glycosyltransferase [Bacillus sp. 3255]MDR6878880.1 glycosyltransferase involved in cell wall biosynthesis [Bacillus sp. 3255]